MYVLKKESILHKSESDLVKKFLIAQELNPVKNDLSLQFREDLKMCDITLTRQEISNMKKHKFKKHKPILLETS